MRRASTARSAKFFVRRVSVSEPCSAHLKIDLKKRVSRNQFSVLRSALLLGTHSDIGFEHFGDWATAFGVVCGLLEGCSICVGDPSDHVEMDCGYCPPGVLFLHGESG